MAKGRKAEAGTLEAREFVNNGRFLEVLTDGTKSKEYRLSDEARARILKAVKFSLGIKDNVTVEKVPNDAKLQEEIQEEHKAEAVTVRKQKKYNKKKELEIDRELAVENAQIQQEGRALSTSLQDAKEGDEYFAPEDCKPVDY